MQVGRPGTFEKGKSGNPVGRPKGCKDKITKMKEAFFCVFTERGKDGLREFAQKDPAGFYRTWASIMPKEQVIDLNMFQHETTLDELE